VGDAGGVQRPHRRGGRFRRWKQRNDKRMRHVRILA
jgi:hypothetical protein